MSDSTHISAALSTFEAISICSRIEPIQLHNRSTIHDMAALARDSGGYPFIGSYSKHRSRVNFGPRCRANQNLPYEGETREVEVSASARQRFTSPI